MSEFAEIAQKIIKAKYGEILVLDNRESALLKALQSKLNVICFVTTKQMDEIKKRFGENKTPSDGACIKDACKVEIKRKDKADLQRGGGQSEE